MMMTDFSEFDGLVFDCDGTLADTMPAHFVSWTATLQRYGLDALFPEDRFYSLGGVPTGVIVAQLAKEAGITVDVEAVSAEKEAEFHNAIAHVGIVEPVVTIARQYHGQLPLAVATGTVRWSAQRILEHLELRQLFDHMVCADDVTQHKPHPEVYLTAAQKLGVDPTRCCAFEDTDLGLQSARAAGMTAVDVRPMYERRWITK